MDAAAIEAQSFKLGLPGEGRRLKDHLFDGEQVIGLANAVVFQNSRALMVATRFRVLLVRAGFRSSTIVKRFEWADVESLESYKPKWHEMGEEVLHFRGPGLDERILVVSGWQDFAKAAQGLLTSRSSAKPVEQTELPTLLPKSEPVADSIAGRSTPVTRPTIERASQPETGHEPRRGFLVGVAALVAVAGIGWFVVSRTTDEAESACATAWANATKVSRMQDTLSDYVSTLYACATVSEWIAENKAHGERLGAEVDTLANFCRNFSVATDLCDMADAQSPDAVTP